MSGIDFSRFSDAALQAALFSIARCTTWETYLPPVKYELRVMAGLLDVELQGRSNGQPHVGWRPRVIPGDGV